MALKRIQLEIKEQETESHKGFTAGPVDPDQNLFTWVATIDGPTGTPYENGTYYLSIKIPADYPQRPPAVKFLTKILHPNIHPTSLEMSLDILTTHWSPSLTIKKILFDVFSFLSDPNFDQPLNPKVANIFKKDPSKYFDTVRDHCIKYACL